MSLNLHCKIIFQPAKFEIFNTEQIQSKKKFSVTQSQNLLGGPGGPECNEAPRTHSSQDS